ncbi:MAG: bifunctional DNA-formamidopyrimidine glycosylase/DNA-(apurinic or apyrimidinic site) lyase [Deinococcus sp.]|nr:bifunctional DNA-formamidopyrimidine glycosylase/DNA-(apurinic or apyrimidinic site) lyase [Deinococcus sp.]
MPELPEVETIRRGLEDQVVGRKIRAVAAQDPQRCRGLSQAVGHTIGALNRRGKYLLFDLGDRHLVVHLGMTGQLAFQPVLPTHRHLRVALELDRGYLVLFDQRRFGKMVVTAPGEYGPLPTLARLGPEPLSPEFRPGPFAQAVAKAAKIKPLLLSQRVVAGLGNIYADEALFRAKIHPAQGRLNQRQAEQLFEAIRQVVAQAISHRGTTLRDRKYLDPERQPGENQHFLQVFQRAGEPCVVCGTAIQKIRLGGRGTHFCPSCQPLRPTAHLARGTTRE